MLHTFDPATAEAIRASLPEDLLAHADAGTYLPTPGVDGRHWAPDDAVATAVVAAPRGDA